MKFTALAIAIITTPALAQVSYPPGGVQISDVNAAIAAATPAPCTAPLSDTLAASAGTAPLCMPRPDAVRATQVQSGRGIIASDGTFNIAWPSQTLFAAAPTYGHAEILGGAAPYNCDIITLTTTNVTGKCYMMVAATLPTTPTALLGLVVSPFANATAGLTVMAVGRQ